jgi:SPP1 gp7 family putative phage head morphogenesis protein
MNYWAQRQAKSQEKLTDKNIKEVEAKMREQYQRAMKNTIESFEATYNKVLLSVAEGRKPTPADLYKLDSYWQMTGQLKKELLRLGDKQAAILTKQFMRQYAEIYEAIALKGNLTFGKVDESVAKQIINQIWCADGQSWSSRIWKNIDKLQEALNESLVECLATGKNPAELKKKLQHQFGVSYNRADSIVRTEMVHIQTQAAQQRYKDAGVREVEVWASADERRCEVCGELHQKRYPIGAQLPIPAHPRCRCTILPVIETKI